MKTLNVKNGKELVKKVYDVEVFGDPDTWMLHCKASSKKEGWMKSTKVMNLPNGVVIQVSTQQGNQVSEAIQFVPGITYIKDENRFSS